MRRVVDPARLRRFMRELGAAARDDARIYLVGGASAVLLGWRETTIDVDLQIVPDRDELLRAIAELKEELQVNVELASPAHFVPELPGWETRSLFITREGRVSFYHYDFYSQALAKLERGHLQDRADVASMISTGLVERQRLRDLFAAAAAQLYRYPAIDERALRRALDEALAE